jgi:hypothetical protein
MHMREIENALSTGIYPQENAFYPQVLGQLCTIGGSAGVRGIRL